jgi:hypothetical protein
MPVTLDHVQIQTALKQFDIREHDYYLLFTGNIVYIVWCTTGAKALQYVTENSCVAIDIKGDWYYCAEMPEDYVPSTYECVRYILAAT